MLVIGGVAVVVVTLPLLCVCVCVSFFSFFHCFAAFTCHCCCNCNIFRFLFLFVSFQRCLFICWLVCFTMSTVCTEFFIENDYVNGLGRQQSVMHFSIKKNCFKIYVSTFIENSFFWLFYRNKLHTMKFIVNALNQLYNRNRSLSIIVICYVIGTDLLAVFALKKCRMFNSFFCYC